MPYPNLVLFPPLPFSTPLPSPLAPSQRGLTHVCKNATHCSAPLTVRQHSITRMKTVRSPYYRLRSVTYLLPRMYPAAISNGHEVLIITLPMQLDEKGSNCMRG